MRAHKPAYPSPAQMLKSRGQRVHPINGDANSTIEQPGEDDSSHGKASDRVLEAGDSRLLTLREIMAMLGWKEGIFSGMNTYVTMALTTPVPEIRERCKSGWATLGVVSALLAGVSIIPPLSAQSTMGLDTSIDVWTNAWMVGLLYVSFLAFMANIAVIICTSLFYIYIDHVFTREGIKEFLRDWIRVLLAIPFIFTTSVLLVVIEVLMVVGYTCRRYHIWVLVGIAGGVVLSLIALALSLAAWVGRRAANLYLAAKKQEQEEGKEEGEEGKEGKEGKEGRAEGKEGGWGREGGGGRGGGGGGGGGGGRGFEEEEGAQQGTEVQGLRGGQQEGRRGGEAVAEAVERGKAGSGMEAALGAAGGSGGAGEGAGGGGGGGARVPAQLSGN